eukprot:1924086-Amphidinium_carterae.1
MDEAYVSSIRSYIHLSVRVSICLSIRDVPGDPSSSPVASAYESRWHGCPPLVLVQLNFALASRTYASIAVSYTHLRAHETEADL